MYSPGNRLRAFELNHRRGVVIGVGQDIVRAYSDIYGGSPLQHRILPGRRYLLESMIVYSAHASADFRFRFQAPSTFMNMTCWAIPNGSSAANGPILHDRFTGNGTSVGGGGVGVAMTMRATGLLLPGVGGMLQFQFRQDTAHDSNFTLWGDSWIKLTQFDV